MLPTSGRCINHPARPGVGLCMECRRTVCRECSTPFEGINRCADCLARLRGAATTALAPEREWRFASVGVSLAFVGLASLAALAMSYCATPR